MKVIKSIAGIVILLFLIGLLSKSCEPVSNSTIPVSTLSVTTNGGDHYQDIANTVTTETNLYRDSIPANTIINNGDAFHITYGGYIVNNTNAKIINVYFGPNGGNKDCKLLSFSLPILSSASWCITIQFEKCGSMEAVSISQGTVTGANATDLVAFPININYAKSNFFTLTTTQGAATDIHAIIEKRIFEPAKL